MLRSRKTGALPETPIFGNWQFLWLILHYHWSNYADFTFYCRWEYCKKHTVSTASSVQFQMVYCPFPCRLFGFHQCIYWYEKGSKTIAIGWIEHFTDEIQPYNSLEQRRIGFRMTWAWKCRFTNQNSASEAKNQPRQITYFNAFNNHLYLLRSY